MLRLSGPLVLIGLYQQSFNVTTSLSKAKLRALC